MGAQMPLLPQLAPVASPAGCRRQQQQLLQHRKQQQLLWMQNGTKNFRTCWLRAVWR
jgi:hypothetical protein